MMEFLAINNEIFPYKISLPSLLKMSLPGNPNMAASLSLMEQNLARITFYHNLPRLRQDLHSLFYNCGTLRPNVGIFQSGAGNITLFYLSGVVPITYHGANYNIPVTMYIDPPYPNQPPRVFVTPTSDMVIRPNHQSVDANGRVYLPQLSQWNSASSNIVSIVAILSQVFSAAPPVNAVRTPQAAQLVVSDSSRRDALIRSITVKIRAKLPTRIKAEVEALNEARSEQSRLKHTNSILEKSLSDLTSLKLRMESKETQLDQLDVEIREWLRKQSPDSTDISAIAYLEPENAVGQQLIDLSSEECAHEDLIDFLTQLHREGKISMSDLLKEIRLLTRKVFELKTLARRASVLLQARALSAH